MKGSLAKEMRERSGGVMAATVMEWRKKAGRRVQPRSGMTTVGAARR